MVMPWPCWPVGSGGGHGSKRYLVDPSIVLLAVILERDRQKRKCCVGSDGVDAYRIEFFNDPVCFILVTRLAGQGTRTLASVLAEYQFSDQCKVV